MISISRGGTWTDFGPLKRDVQSLHVEGPHFAVGVVDPSDDMASFLGAVRSLRSGLSFVSAVFWMAFLALSRVPVAPIDTFAPGSPYGMDDWIDARRPFFPTLKNGMRRRHAWVSRGLTYEFDGVPGGALAFLGAFWRLWFGWPVQWVNASNPLPLGWSGFHRRVDKGSRTPLKVGGYMSTPVFESRHELVAHVEAVLGGYPTVAGVGEESVKEAVDVA